jgi:hypothetical protein
MTDIRKSLESLADAIEKIDSKPAPAPVINDRSLSGNKIHGGIITKFASAGIIDEAKSRVLTVNDSGIVVSNASIRTVSNDLTVKGALTVEGEITATRLNVNEINADIRNERTSPLEFRDDKGKVPYNKGLLWAGGAYTKQFVLQGGQDRFFSSESIDIHASKEYRIGNEAVLSSDRLGSGIVNSNLRTVGLLDNLSIAGTLSVDEYFRYNADTQQLSIGAEEPNGMLTMESWDHQFVIDPSEDNQWKVGTWTTSALHIITDDTTRITIGPNGNVTIKGKTNFERGVGIGVKNFTDDADLTVAGPVRFQDKKFEVGSGIPTAGNYKKGDIVWNENPQSTSYIGWVCTREGSPGEWKPFGQVA